MECALTLSSCWLPILCVDENKTETEGSQVMRKRKRGGREGGSSLGEEGFVSWWLSSRGSEWDRERISCSAGSRSADTLRAATHRETETVNVLFTVLILVRALVLVLNAHAVKRMSQSWHARGQEWHSVSVYESESGLKEQQALVFTISFC